MCGGTPRSPAGSPLHVLDAIRDGLSKRPVAKQLLSDQSRCAESAASRHQGCSVNRRRTSSMDTSCCVARTRKRSRWQALRLRSWRWESPRRRVHRVSLELCARPKTQLPPPSHGADTVPAILRRQAAWFSYLRMTAYSLATRGHDVAAFVAAGTGGGVSGGPPPSTMVHCDSCGACISSMLTPSGAEM